MTPVPRNLPKQNALWEFIVNEYEVKELKKTLNSMDYREVGEFLTECDRMASDILHEKPEYSYFDKNRTVAVIIAVRKIAVTIGRKKLKEVM